MRHYLATLAPKIFAFALAAASLGLFVAPDTAQAQGARGKACTVPDQQAKIVVNPIVEVPEIAAEQGITGRVIVWIDLSPAGQLKDAAVTQSSGNLMLDKAALRIARSSQFAPAQQDCQPVERAYLYVVSFDPTA